VNGAAWITSKIRRILAGTPMDRLLAVLVAASALAFAPSSALAMRCGMHLIDRGDTRIELLARCGEPTDVSQRVEQVMVGSRYAHEFEAQAVTILIESWDYNFGPTRLMRRVELRDGTISAIETLGQGYEPSAVGGADSPIHLGDAPTRVRTAWGEPADRSLRMEAVMVGTHGSSTGRAAAATQASHHASAAADPASGVAVVRVSVEVQTWTYNFGPTRLMRRVTFRDGHVVSVETLGVGF